MGIGTATLKNCAEHGFDADSASKNDEIVENLTIGVHAKRKPALQHTQNYEEHDSGADSDAKSEEMRQQ